MPLNRGARGACMIALLGAALVVALAAAPAPAREPRPRPLAAVLLERLCAQNLRPNEEDRLFGLISLAVRTTIKYEGAVFDPDLIDDSMQDALAAITASCRELAALGDAYRLGRAVELARDATLRRLRDGEAAYSDAQVDNATAADLSEELSAPEIDAWLDALPPRRRALALLLYTPRPGEGAMAAAVGLQPAALAQGFRAAKTDLLRFFRAEADGDATVGGDAPPPRRPALEFRIAGPTLAGLLNPVPPAAAAVAASPAPEPPAASPKIRITGISSDFYAGWSLLATVSFLPSGQSLDIPQPILLEPDRPGHKRMIVVAADEVSDPHDTPRRFLLKAYAIDADKEGAGLADGFHLAAATIDNRAALHTLANRSLAAIEVARCLWHDYETAADPGLCR